MALAITDAEYEKRASSMRQSSLDCLAPKFRQAVEAAIQECHAKSVDAVVFETCRSDALAFLYYEHGVSKATDATRTWHGYGLAVDVISKAHGWDYYPGGPLYHANPWWWKELYETFTHHGLDSGSDWQTFKDYPHWQWGACKASPSDRGRELLASGGREAVWREVGAS